MRVDCTLNQRGTCEEIGAQLAAIGISVDVNAQPFPEYRELLGSRATDFYSSGVQASATFDSAEVLRDMYHSPSHSWLNATGNTNPAMDRLIEQIDGEVVTYVRDGLLEQAWRMAIDEMTLVPLYRIDVLWAMRSSLDLPITPTSIPYFREARFTR